MKKITWIVEKYLFEEYEKQLCDTILDSGHDCVLLDDSDHRFDFDKQIKNKYKEDDCVIFYGSLQLGQRIYRNTNFQPGIFLTIENYECFKYYGHYGDELVNSDYMLFGLNDILRNKEKIFNYFGTEHIFIRPSNGYKSFPGQLLPKDNFQSEFDILCRSYGGIDLQQLVLVSGKKNVVEESRFIISNLNGENQIIDGNKYMVNGDLINDRIVDEKAIDYLKTIVNKYTPDKMFTIDIAKLDDGTYKVLEIGSFCCAGWYNMDLDIVVEETNKQVISEYNDYFNID